MKQSLTIAALVDRGTIQEDDPQFENMEGKTLTEYHVIEALRHLGHDVRAIGVFDDIHTVIQELQDTSPDLVFNLTEQFYGDRRFDKHIVGVLELLQLPYTGSGMMGLMLCRDKRLCKQLLALHRIRVPNLVSLPMGRTPHIPRSTTYPQVVKPALEDGSEGISNASLVYNADALIERAEFIHDRWEQDAIAEEYIEGRECYITLLGNKRLTVLPPRECRFDHDGEGGPSMATYHVKWNDKYREKWGIDFDFADFDEETMERCKRICRRVFRVLCLQDYARIDLRIGPDGRMTILEANPNPGLAYGEEVAESAEKAGIGYEQLIDRIVRSALRRHEETGS
jgi:D-alanine-D-alanine ligase